MTNKCAICGFEINIGGNPWSPPVYDNTKEEHYHYTCWHLTPAEGEKND